MQGALLFVEELDLLGDDTRGVARLTFGWRLAEYPGVAILAGTRAGVPLFDGPLGVIVVPFAVLDVRRRQASRTAALRTTD